VRACVRVALALSRRVPGKGPRKHLSTWLRVHVTAAAGHAYQEELVEVLQVGGRFAAPASYEPSSKRNECTHAQATRRSSVSTHVSPACACLRPAAAATP
jgi:hypothetical protein